MAKARAATKRAPRRRKPVKVHFSELQNRRVRARYDVAQDTDENSRLYNGLVTTSAAQELTLAVRTKLRNRARNEVANDPYANGIGHTLANHVIGRCPRVNIKPSQEGREKSAQRREREFMRWAKAVRLGQKLRMGVLSVYRDGEIFVQKITNDKIKHPVKLDIALIETDRIDCAPYGRGRDDEIEGIVYDTIGNPVKYRVLDCHPGDGYAAGGFTWVPASQMSHWYDPDRPGQLRGAPGITPSIELFGERRRYRRATIAAAETAAENAMVLQTGAPAEGLDEVAAAMESVELERRMATFLPAGYELSQTKAEQPTTTFNDFDGRMLNEAARSVDMPYNIAACNSSGYNYASGNLDHLGFWRTVCIKQYDIECMVLDDLFEAWNKEADLIPGYLDEMDEEDEHKWFFDRRVHADPVKEATAQATRIATGTSTYEEEAEMDGVDPEARWAQRAKEWKRAKEEGIPYPVPQGTTANQTQGDGDGAGETEN